MKSGKYLKVSLIKRLYRALRQAEYKVHYNGYAEGVGLVETNGLPCRSFKALCNIKLVASGM